RDRRPGQDPAHRILLWLRDGHRRPAALSESRLRRGGGPKVERKAVLRGSRLFPLEGSGEPVPGRHVCAFCHVGPNPIKPPADPENPRWENLSSNDGAQFFWWDRVFDWNATTNQQCFTFQSLHTSLPGTLGTSLVSTDNINNPRTMNAVYYLGPRVGLASRWGEGAR